MWTTLSSFTDQITQIASEAMGPDEEDERDDENVSSLRTSKTADSDDLAGLVSAQKAEVSLILPPFISC